MHKKYTMIYSGQVADDNLPPAQVEFAYWCITVSAGYQTLPVYKFYDWTSNIYYAIYHQKTDVISNFACDRQHSGFTSFIAHAVNVLWQKPCFDVTKEWG